MDGRALAARIRAEVAEEVRGARRADARDRAVGDDPASRHLHPPQARGRTAAGIARSTTSSRRTRPRTSCSRSIAELNADDAIDGLLVQLPLPAQVDEDRVIRRSTR